MDEQACPRCKTTKYRNPSLKLMVNVCGHTLCEACVDLLFLKGSGSCPECNVPLRRNNFRVQLFEDPMVEKEVDIRRRILRDYNKREEDFGSLEEYNDYLEEIESIVYNLCNNIEIIETNKRIEAYKRDNREVIQRNKTRVGRDEYELEEMLELERVQEEARKKELEELELEHKKKKARDKQALIEELMHSGKDAAQIVSEFAEKAEKQREEEKQLPPLKSINEFSTGIKFGQTTDTTFLPVPKSEEGPLFIYEPLELITEGPMPPPPSDIEGMGYISHIRAETPQENAGGFTSTLACQRALQEALQCLYYTSTAGMAAGT
ncbi:CDK-activating kinase assembly factor MAT1 [Scaptodrosophila lebanonensis]|uniref:CDK-activating kinase assembly factor MAT1 n=1 Tax=Drosophila lebanonensis TaxID=7225 RepID=A0A6J2TBT4_DROLE|nr:CDK-activating kinase assembly factor MAT1 [Scaptodrosophila lebanonensis]